MNSKFFKFIYLIGIALVFFPCFVLFFIPKTSINMILCLIFAVIVPTLLLLQNPHRFLSFLTKVVKLKLFIIYSLFLGFMTISTIIHNMLGYNIESWYLNTFYFINFYCTVILLFLYPLWSLYIKIRLKTIIRLFYIMIFITLLIGLLQFLSEMLHVTIINSIIHCFTNSRYIYDDVEYETFRVNSLYKEPSTFAAFIFVVLPFIFNITFSKYKLFNYKVINFSFKLIVLPLAIFVLFLTSSPVYIIVSLIELIILSVVKFKHYLYNKAIFVSLIIVASLFVITLRQAGQTIKNNIVVSRISTTVNSDFKLDNLLLTETSLATRISTGGIYIKIFHKNPIFGVGLNNSNSYADRIFTKLTIPVTSELKEQYVKRYCIMLNGAIFWKILAEGGLIGICLYLWFFISCFRFLYKNRHLYQGLELSFISSLLAALVAIGIFSTFYFENYDKLHFWLLYGFVLLLCYRLKYYKQ